MEKGSAVALQSLFAVAKEPFLGKKSLGKRMGKRMGKKNRERSNCLRNYRERKPWEGKMQNAFRQSAKAATPAFPPTAQDL